MSHYRVGRIGQTPNIEFGTTTCLIEAIGAERLQRITIRHVASGETETLPASSLFVMIGAMPHTNWLAGLVERDEQGFVMAGAGPPPRGGRGQGGNPAPPPSPR